MEKIKGTIKKYISGKRRTKKIKPINCHPNAEKDSLKSRPTCMTSKIIKKIKEDYNKTHDDKINENKPSLIWDALREKIKSCDREDCWLNQIQDEKLKQKFMESLFAPFHPDEWKQNPSAWLSNHDIFNVLSQYEKAYSDFRFIGPTPIDFESVPQTYDDVCVWKDLCKFSLQKEVNKGFKKIGVIFNLDKHTGPGTHWTSLFIDVTEKFIFYFDSAGDSLPTEVKKLVEKVMQQGLELTQPTKFTYYDTHMLEHQKGNNECGMYSLFFIITMLTNKVNNKKFKNMKQKLNYFTKNRINDKFVFQKRKQYFNEE